MTIRNEAMAQRRFLDAMVSDAYFPRALVDAGQRILAGLCVAIERERPSDDVAVLALSHAATEEFNSLASEFEEFETAAREAVAADFAAILAAYGFTIDIEAAIAPREW